MKILAIIQARCNSSRFPNKIMKKFGKSESIIFQYKRIKKSKKISKIIVATSNNNKDDKLVKLLKKNKIDYFRGSEKNVLSRFYECAKKEKPDAVVRFTADCPLIDYKIIDRVIELFKSKKCEYASNITPPTFPDGMDVEIFKMKTLIKTFKSAKTKYEKEHVTTYIQRNKKIKKENLYNNEDLSKIRLTLDTSQDYYKIKSLLKKIGNKNLFTLSQIIDIVKNKNFFSFDQSNSGYKLWQSANKAIAGGNLLISKNPNFFMPGGWPTYYKKARDCYIWDLNNKKYIDFSTMSVGTNLLGYSNRFVNKKVINAINQSNMSSLNAPEEVYLAEKLKKMHNWDDAKLRFAKSGGEANAIAIRLARAFTGTDKVAICGYHGWYDWYLATNLKSKKNLDQLLIENLSIGGVPRNLKNTIFPFKYNDFKNFKKIVNKNKIRIVKMEVIRNEMPRNNFLKKIQSYCEKKNIVLIFDECTSGFRETFGGICKKFNLLPDILILGKALGNGYPITAIMGKSKIMNSINKTFISSTFWTDRVGFVAALASLDEMNKKKSWLYVKNYGLKVKKLWKKIAKKNNIKIKVTGLPALLNLNFLSKNHELYKSYMTETLLKNNIIGSTIFYSSMAHNISHLKYYNKILNKIFSKIKDYEEGDLKAISLKYPMSVKTFQRLN